MAIDPTPAPQNDAGDAPQHVFRTFAQDVAKLTGKPLSKQVENVPAPPPRPEPPPAEIIPKAPSTNESKEAVLARLKARVAANPGVPVVQKEGIPPSPPPPVVEAPVAPPPPPQVERPTPIHTYTSDFADEIDAKGASAISVLAAEADAGGGTMGAAPPKKKEKFPVAIFLGFVLILLGGASIYGAYLFVTSSPAVPFFQPVPSLIFADERTELAGTGPELLAALAASAEEPLGDGQIRVTYVRHAATTTDDKVIQEPAPGGVLIAALELPAPEILLRNIGPESTVGIVHAGEETRAFFILRVLSFERTFAGMLEWEGSLAYDLSALYPTYVAALETTATSTAATTTPPAESESIIAAPFVDDIVANHDVRILRDSANRTVMLYGYRDKETLIIARDEAAFEELLKRLNSTRGQ